jgi:hypothetical protein
VRWNALDLFFLKHPKSSKSDQKGKSYDSERILLYQSGISEQWELECKLSASCTINPERCALVKIREVGLHWTSQRVLSSLSLFWNPPDRSISMAIAVTHFCLVSHPRWSPKSTESTQKVKDAKIREVGLHWTSQRVLSSLSLFPNPPDRSISMAIAVTHFRTETASFLN